jgi:hypothetical protein
MRRSSPHYDGTMATVSAIVPATNDPASLDRCLAAIGGAESPPEEVIVVGPPLMPTAAHARNRGAEEANGQILVFVDSDVEVHSDVFRRFRSAFESDPSLAAVFGSYDDSPDGDGTVSAFRNLLHHHVHQTSGGLVKTFWTGLGAVRRDAFVAAKGFNTDLEWLEDIDFGARVAREGGRIELDPEIQGKHLKTMTLRQMVRTDFAHRAIPWTRLLLAGRAPTDQLNLGWRHRASAVACIAAVGALLMRRPLPALAAVGSFVALNRPFYSLLLRRRGASQAAVGVGLHAVHHVTAVAAVPVGVCAHMWATRDGGPNPRRQGGLDTSADGSGPPIRQETEIDIE